MGGIDEPLVLVTRISRVAGIMKLPALRTTVPYIGTKLQSKVLIFLHTPIHTVCIYVFTVMVAVESVTFWRERVQTFSPGTVGGWGFGNHFLSPTNNQQTLQEPRQSSETGV